MSTQRFQVPRELLEELLEAMQPMYSLPAQYYGSTLGERVRALLAQPTDGALTNDGAEPVALTNAQRRAIEAKEQQAFSDWAWNKEGEAVGRMDGQDAAREAWHARAKLAAIPTCTCPFGDVSLRWPCPVHPPEVKPAATFAEGIEAAAKLIDHRRDEYVNEHGSYDHDTGYTEFPGNGEETVEEWMNLAESIRAIKEPNQ